MNRLVKRIVLITTAALMTCSFIFGMSENVFAANAQQVKIDNAEVSIYGIKSPYNMTFDFRSLTEGDNTKYSKSLSVFASLLASDVSIMKENPQIRINGGSGSFMEQMGFQDIEQVELYANNYTYDKNDLSIVTMGRRPLKVNGKEYMIYAAGIVNTHGRIDYWESNFDIGYEGDEYNDVTGEHEEWDKNHTKGIEIASNRVYAVINDYLNKFASEDQNKQKSILFTGHSRGAGIANLIGMKFETDESNTLRTYTYTYAAPRTTTVSQEDAASCKTIFNIVNENDVVVNIPPTDLSGEDVNWDFRRYGTDIMVDIDEDDNLVDEWNQYIAPMLDAERKIPDVNNLQSNLHGVGNEEDLGAFVLSFLALFRDKIKEIPNESLPEDISMLNNQPMDEEFKEQEANTEYVSAEGPAIAEIVGNLIPSREALYTKDVETALSFDGIDTEEDFDQKMSELGLGTYYTMEDYDEDNEEFVIDVCPDIFIKALFLAAKGGELQNDYINVLLNGMLNDTSFSYIKAFLQVVPYLPNIVKGIRACHGDTTYYFMANKIPSEQNDVFPDPESDVPATGDRESFMLWMILGAASLVIFIKFAWCNRWFIAPKKHKK